MPALELLLEAERRGILPEDKKPLLAEARKRGLVPAAGAAEAGRPAKWKELGARDYQDEYNKSLSVPEKFLLGVGAGMKNVAKGVQQLVTSGDDKQKLTDEYDAERVIYEPLRRQSTAAKVGQFIGEAAPFVAIPGPGAAAGLGARVLAGATTGAGIGVAQYVPKGGSRTANALVGGAVGGAVPLALAGGSKVFNALAGKVAPTPVETQAERFRIPLTRGEATGDAAAQRTETLLERLPGWMGGLKGFRLRQNAAADDAAKSFLGRYIVDPTAGNVAEANREFVNGLYQSVRGLLSQVPVEARKVIPSETHRVASKLVDRYPALFKTLGDARTERIVRDIAEGSGRTATNATVLDAAGRQVATTTAMSPGPSFEAMWALREGLGAKIGQARKLVASGAIDETSFGQLKALFGAVSRDMDRWADTLVSEGGTATVARLPSPGGPPRISGATGGPMATVPWSTGRELMRAFKEANKAFETYRIKFDVVQRAYDLASGTVGAGEMFSPKRFSTKLKEIAYKETRGRGSLWSRAEIEEMTGLANVLQVVKRAGQFAENPPTGNRPGMLLAALHAASSVGKLGLSVGTSWVGRYLSTAPSGKALARAASRVEPNSPAMGKLLRQIEARAAQFAAQQATKPGEAHAEQ